MISINALLLLPLLLMIRFFVGLLLVGGRFPARGISWSEAAAQWHHPIKPLSDEEFNKLGFVPAKHFKDFNETLDAILIERVPGTEGHEIVRQYILTELNALGWTVEQDVFRDRTPYGKMDFSNIIATLDPSACRNLVLACHYDSLFKKEFTFYGATDSAVPCAMLIHLARVLDKTLKRNKNSNLTLQLIFFDGEEAFKRWTNSDSLYGSRHLAEKWNKKKPFLNSQHGCSDKEYVSYLDRMDVMVLLDLIGTPNPTFYSFFLDTHNLHLQFVAIEQKMRDLRQMEASDSSSPYFVSTSSLGFVQDDHIPFMRRGVPIVHLIPNPFPKVWHKEGDNRDALHHPTINDLNKILQAFVIQYMHLDMLHDFRM